MLVIYIGAKGRGKTASMIYEGLKYFKNGWKVYSNMQEVNYIPKERQLTYKQIKNIEKLGLKNCVILVDEIQRLFDSRKSANKQQIEFSHFIQQIRKYNIRILGTLQVFGNVEKRIREQSDILAFPKLNKEYGVCSIDYRDMSSVEDQFLHTGNLNVTLGSTINQANSVNITYYAKPIFKLYNHREKILT